MASAAGVGVDLVDVHEIEASLAAFGARFAQRLFTAGERAEAQRAPSPSAAPPACAAAGFDATRLATRFAAKEAALKALGLADAGIDWREIEVEGGGESAPRLRLHGRAAALAAARGVIDLAVSLSHQGPLACAVVVALRAAPRPAAVPVPVFSDSPAERPSA